MTSVCTSSTGTEGFGGGSLGDNESVDHHEVEAQAQATERALKARARLGRSWPIVALVAGLLGVALGLLLAWLV